MKEILGFEAYQSEKKSAVTLGKFDGLHKGHQKLLEKICGYASEEITSIVCAFDMSRDVLMTKEERKEHLDGVVDYLIDCPFTKELREMEAEEFIKKILVDCLHASYIVVGTDFSFGYKKRGTPDMLKEYAEVYGYQVDVIEKEKFEDKIISSTYIKELMQEGNICLTNKLLGYSYQVRGCVEHGNALGRTLGFPTMNVAPQEKKIVPRFGVYVCDVEIDHVLYHGIGNIGVKPTVEKDSKVLVEVFVFDFQGDTYGKTVTVSFREFVRPEMKFQSIEELKKRVDADILYGKRYFSLSDSIGGAQADTQ
ncbi:MAG: bifunctional riboflavin kinase/FAD synthetase [Ruminococcus sp.]|nr:bifunctional riboflavin kinase/FAD synthetase [Ruminococcus sp.]